MSYPNERDEGFSVASYFELVERGIIEADEHVELLEGLIVCSPPQSPLHASVIMDVDQALRRAIGERASVRGQLPLLAGQRSVPEPDFAVVPGTSEDYRSKHPAKALLVIEVSDTSLPQDRLTKSRIYAHAGVSEYWIVNLRHRRLEIYRQPDVERRLYADIRSASIGEVVELAALPGATIAVADLFPGY